MLTDTVGLFLREILRQEGKVVLGALRHDGPFLREILRQEGKVVLDAHRQCGPF